MVKPLRHFLHEMTVGLDMTNNLPKNVEWTGICLLQFDPAVAECQTFYTTTARSAGSCTWRRTA